MESQEALGIDESLRLWKRFQTEIHWNIFLNLSKTIRITLWIIWIFSKCNNKLQYKVTTRFLCNTDNMNSKYCIIIFAWIVTFIHYRSVLNFRIAPEHSVLKRPRTLLHKFLEMPVKFQGVNKNLRWSKELSKINKNTCAIKIYFFGRPVLCTRKKKIPNSINGVSL